MTASSTLPAPNLMPLMRYRNLAEAMGWLEQAFGFDKQTAVSDSDGAIIYGQMTYRGGLMMMGAVRDTDLDKLMRQPDEVGGVETQSCYLVIDDADAHYARAQDAGAEIVLELKSDGLGRRGYSCRDPEGHIWNFGTYNPARSLAVTAAASAPGATSPQPIRRNPRTLMGFAGLLVAFGAAGWWLLDNPQGHRSNHAAQETERAYAELVKVRAEKRNADEAAQTAAAALEAERTRRLALESASGNAADKLAHEEGARRAAEAAVATLRDELKRKQEALDAAIEAKRVSEEKLAVVKSAAMDAPQPKAPEHAEQPSAADRIAARMAPETSGIETSATGPASELQSFRADDDDKIDPASSRSTIAESPRQSRPAGRTVQRKAIRRFSRRPPLYVVDMAHVWPYTHWSK